MRTDVLAAGGLTGIAVMARGSRGTLGEWEWGCSWRQGYVIRDIFLYVGGGASYEADGRVGIGSSIWLRRRLRYFCSGGGILLTGW